MSAFQVQGKTITFTGATVAPTPVQCVSNSGLRTPQYVLTNLGTVPVWIGWGLSTGEATANAVIPTSTATYGMWLMPGNQSTISGPPDAFFTGITSSSTAVVYVTPGYGE
ncbi:MAG TPA: hypothetical protein VF516_03230 [Kofleriaceae bacterium]